MTMGIGSVIFAILKVQTPQQITRKQFSRWLTGFIDAEGIFQVFRDQARLRVIYVFTYISMI